MIAMRARLLGRRILTAGAMALAAACLIVGSSVAAAAVKPLAERLTPAVASAVFPNAERLGPEQGTPPAIAVFRGADIVGYIFSTLDVVAAPGYSGVPFDVIAGVTLDGVITGAQVISQSEPHIYGDPVRAQNLDTFLARHADSKVRGGNDRMLAPDFVAGATVSARSMRAAIYDSARIVLRARSPRPPVSEPMLDLEGFAIKSWNELLAQGSIVRRRVTNAEAADILAKAGGVKPEVDFGASPDGTYIEIFTALATPQAIGRNMFGGREFADYTSGMVPGTHLIAVASRGEYDFLGIKYYRPGAVFDRFRLVQDDRTIEFTNKEFRRSSILSLDRAALYSVAPDKGFDPLKPWHLDILIHGTDAAGKTVTAAFPVNYNLPQAHILMPEVEPPPAWVEAWQDARGNIAVLAGLLAVLTLILAFQSRLVRNRHAHRWVRNGFLVFVVVWLGWVAGGQLSIINVVNYSLAAVHGFDLGYYLAEPLIVIVAAYAAVSLLLLGRGVFCGWLCPFGALQELLAQVARALGLPQWTPSAALQRRLWLVKYVAAAIVLGLGFVDATTATQASEVEPFKTAITAHFARDWPFVIYAGALLGVGLFTERAYCRFLCPLGGTLALLDRLHLVDLLKRRPQCGNPCRLCESSCPVKAIEPSGRIKMAECFQCLDCQVEYRDENRCPPLVQARKVRLRGEAASAPIAAVAE